MKEIVYMIEKNDWRLSGGREYLQKLKLIKAEYKMKCKTSDHEHCAFCWEKFSESHEDLNTGYCSIDGKHWICEECFEDFKEMFDFRVISN